MPAAARRSTSMTLGSQLLVEAQAFGVNISRAAEAGIAAEVKLAREKAWKEENAEAIAATNAYVEKYGLPIRPIWDEQPDLWAELTQDAETV